MATISSIVAAARGNSQRGRNVYMVEKEIDLSVTTVDPSAGDVVQMISFDAGTVVLSAGAEFTEALAGAGSDCTISLGCSTVDADGFVSAFDADAATAGSYATPNTPVGVTPQFIAGTDGDTLDLTFAGTDAGIASGKIRVFAVCMDVTALGDMAANEVARDALA